MTDLRKLTEAARDGVPRAIARWNQGAVTLDHYLAVLDERDALRVEYQRLRQALEEIEAGTLRPAHFVAREALEAGT